MMGLISDPQAWLSFLTLALLEIVLGIDNIIFLVVLVDRLPEAQRKSARFLGLGAFLVVKSIMEIREMLAGKPPTRKSGMMNGFWLIIVQIGLIDIVFSLDSVFTAVGLAKHIEVMIAAIVASVLVMMVVSTAVGAFIERHPSIKVLALAFLVIVGIALIAESLELEMPKGYLYFAMAFSLVVEWINIRLRGRGAPRR
jgi:predicted tellurium resistance membrane protein TerC